MADIVAKFLEAKKVGRYSVYLMDYGAPIGYRVFAKGPDFHEQLAEAVSRVNKDLTVAERVRRFVVGDPFSVENGMMTPSMKRSAATSS
ncbi:MAG: hypothetical protein O7G83_21190 [Proteobacteria bacterium]|nr:hypothetical protein [Pseudomonadota bacterium]